MTKERRDEIAQILEGQKRIGHTWHALDHDEIQELLAAADENAALKHGLTLHPSVMTQQNVAMLAFKYDELKQDLAAKEKLIDAIWLIVRKHGYEYGPLNEAVGQMVHDIMEQREELKKENADLKRDKERLDKLVAMIWATRWVCEEKDYMHMVGIAAEMRSGNFKGIDAAQAKEGAK